MRVTGGTEGAAGGARLRGDVLILRGGMRIRARRVRRVRTREQREWRIGWLSVALGAPLLGVTGVAVAGLPGGIVGVLLALAGSGYRRRGVSVSVELRDGGSVDLECSRREARRLVRWGGG